ncbi:MAG: hypothetical protein MPJ25_06975 [Pirellulales bacterium]|nr:hypothetical protein [Pirellulales bacterium]
MNDSIYDSPLDYHIHAEEQDRLMAFGKKLQKQDKVEADAFEKKHKNLFNYLRSKYPKWNEHWIFSGCVSIWEAMKDKEYRNLVYITDRKLFEAITS